MTEDELKLFMEKGMAMQKEADNVIAMYSDEHLDQELEDALYTPDHGMEMIAHPLCHTLYSGVPGLHNKQLKYAKERLKRAENENDWPIYVFTHERPYRTEAFDRLLTARHISLHEASACALLSEVWVDSENHHQCLPFWARMFRGSQGWNWMSDDEHDAFNQLPSEIEIWRGECDDGGYSWTRDEKIAKFFANRGINESTGKVSHGWIAKPFVFAYLMGRNEEEILIKAKEMIRDSR